MILRILREHKMFRMKLFSLISKSENGVTLIV
jgi:hypothetical protein